MKTDVIELTITIKDEERKKMSKSFLVYENLEKVELTREDTTIKKYLKELLDEFKGEVDTIKIRATMDLK